MEADEAKCLSCSGPDGRVAAPHFHVARRLDVDVGVELLQRQLGVCLGLLCSLVHHLAHVGVNFLSQKSSQCTWCRHPCVYGSVVRFSFGNSQWAAEKDIVT